MTTQTPTLSPDAERLLNRLRGSTRQFWVTPADSVPDAWVLVAPVRLRYIAAVRVKEEAITELVNAGLTTWTAADEPVPEYMPGSILREAWFRGRKGRRIAATGVVG